MVIRSYRLSTHLIHAAVSAMLFALMLQPVTAGACDFPVSKIGDYTDGSISQPVILIGTVSAIRAIKSDPFATHLITLTVERNFSPKSQPPSAVLRSYETGQTYYCGPPRALENEARRVAPQKEKLAPTDCRASSIFGFAQFDSPR
jgi:hypothetical protein